MAEIRPFEPADREAVIGLWRRAAFLPLTPEDANTTFDDHIKPRCDIWVATAGSRLVAYLAIAGSMIDRLYVDPPDQESGHGSRLLDLAKELRPGGLELYTHLENRKARSFYENRGFEAIEFGISPPPESMPDVKYRWTPS